MCIRNIVVFVNVEDGRRNLPYELQQGILAWGRYIHDGHEEKFAERRLLARDQIYPLIPFKRYNRSFSSTTRAAFGEH